MNWQTRWGRTVWIAIPAILYITGLTAWLIKFHTKKTNCGYDSTDENAHNACATVEEATVVRTTPTDGREIEVSAIAKARLSSSLIELSGAVWLERSHSNGQDAYPLTITSSTGQFGLLAVADGLGGAGANRVIGNNALSGARIAADLVIGEFARFFLKWITEAAPSQGRQSLSNRINWKVEDQFEHSTKLYQADTSQQSDNNATDLDNDKANFEILYDYVSCRSLSNIVRSFDTASFAKAVDKRFADYVNNHDFENSIVRSKQRRKLPTTFAAIIYESTGKNVCFRPIWAGDSRCYLLNKEGIAILTEDESEGYYTSVDKHIWPAQMTNYVSEMGRNRFRSYLSHADAPCCLFTCSDGVAEIARTVHEFEEIIVGCILMSDSLASIVNNFETLFDKVAGDDCSISFSFVGFESFNQVKCYFIDATKSWNAFHNPDTSNSDIENQVDKKNANYRRYAGRMNLGN